MSEPMRALRAARRPARPRRGNTPRNERHPELLRQVPYLALVRRPTEPRPDARPGPTFEVATYNVHRWAGVTGGRRFLPALADDVIGELGADVIALQEVLRPFRSGDPLVQIAERLRFHLAFVATRIHRRGELGNAILSRWPIGAAFTLDLTVGRLERRSAVAAQFRGEHGPVSIVSTHLGIVDRTREHQVRSLLQHPQLQGSAVLLGDMNAWRRCRATRELDREFTTRHHNRNWPATFPAGRPVLALDRVYARGARVTALRTHSTATSRRASDHLPVIARVELDPPPA